MLSQLVVGGIWGYVDAVISLVVGIFSSDLKTAAAGLVYFFHLVGIVHNRSAAGKIGSGKGIDYVGVGVADEIDGGLAHLRKVKGTYGACHSDGDTRVGVYKHRRKCHRKEGRLFHRGIVVVNKITVSLEMSAKISAENFASPASV